MKGSFTIRYRGESSTTSSVYYKLVFFCKYGPNKTDLFTPVVIEEFNDLFGGTTERTHTVAFDFNRGGTVTLRKDEKVWPMFLIMTGNTGNTVSPWRDLIISFTEDAFFKVSSFTRAQDTSSKAWMINEATSRVIESITDNRLRLYSEYLGRNDSAPFNFAGHGCGADRILTNGLQIRQVRLADGSIPSVFLSLKDIFEALAATDNIGMGQANENTMRIENWK